VPADDVEALAGLRFVAFESRRAAELARMLERHGATVLSAPALREAPLPPSPATAELARALAAGEVAVLVLLTGVGTRALAGALTPDPSALPALLATTRLIARGPKPLAALRALGVANAIPVPSPNTWREVLATLDGLGLAPGSLIAVQEYGGPPRDLLDGLAARGHRTLAVQVYRWALPTDTTALRAGLAAITAGTADAAVFTSATQVEHAFAVADDADALRAAFATLAVVSIGPVCSEALDAHGVAVDLEADPPKMGVLVALAAERVPPIVAAKRH
jgi:uroporphyrinogen-III synthase